MNTSGIDTERAAYIAAKKHLDHCSEELARKVSPLLEAAETVEELNLLIEALPKTWPGTRRVYQKMLELEG